MVTSENIRKIATAQGNDNRTGCLLNYPYFKVHYQVIAINLSKQQALDADPRVTEQISFTGNLDSAGEKAMFYFSRKAKETILDFSKGTVKVFWLLASKFNVGLI